LTMTQKTSDIDLRDAFFDALYDIAKDDSNVLCLAADMGAFSLNRFKKDLSRQYINVGVAEQNLVSVAAGLALGGKRVFLYAIAPFITQRCYEQIKIDLSCMCLPVTLIGVGAGIAYSSDGPTHHATQDIAALRALPAMTILNPSDSTSAAAAARIAYQSSGPVYIRIDKGRFPLLYDAEDSLSDGLSLVKDGSDAVIVTTGVMVHRAREVADKLRKHSIDAGIVDVFLLKPMNEEKLLGIVEQYGRVITLEEHSIIGGLGSAVCEILIDRQKAVPVKRIALADTYCEGYGDRQWMHEFYGLDVKNVTRTILDFCQSTESAATDEIRPANRTKPHDDITRSLTLPDFARLFGTTQDDIPDSCRQVIARTDLRCRRLAGRERDEVLLRVLKTIESDSLTVVGPQRKPVWEQGWSENLRNFVASNYDLNELLPKFVKLNEVTRLLDSYVMSPNTNFETSVVTVLRSYLFHKYFSDASAVFEFGCGTGLNLVALARTFPGKRLYGLDWSAASRDIVNKIAEKYGMRMSGALFDMFAPDYRLDVPEHSVMFTIGTMEQLGTGFEAFLQFLLDKKFSICINIETLYELYDQSKLFDYVAARYLEKRGYLRGYLARLRDLETQGKIEIIKTQHSFGSLYHDGYSFVIWRPRK